MKAKELIKNEVQGPLIGDGKQTIDEWAVQHVEACYELSSGFDRGCMISCVKAGFEAYKNNSSVSIPQKTLQECKDEVARNRGYKEWCQLFTACGNEALQKRMDEAAELYASQIQMAPWILVTSETLPEFHVLVLVIEWISGFSDPVVLIGSWEGNRWRLYGGLTADRVTHWMPLPSAPQV